MVINRFFKVLLYLLKYKGVYHKYKILNSDDETQCQFVRNIRWKIKIIQYFVLKKKFLFHCMKNMFNFMVRQSTLFTFYKNAYVLG